MERQWYRGARCQSGGHSGVQAHGKIEKSKHPELHPSTTGSTPRPRRRLTVCIHNSVSFTRKPLSTTSKNDHHLEELTISIAMDNTELLITNVSPGQFLQWAVFTTDRPLADRHRFTSARRLQCSPFTLALRNNRYERQSTGGFNQHFQHCSPKYRFNHKTPWEFRPQFSRCIISITSSEWQTHTTMVSDHLPILIGLQTIATSSPSRHRTYINLKNADWTRYRQENANRAPVIFQLIARKTRRCSERHY